MPAGPIVAVDGGERASQQQATSPVAAPCRCRCCGRTASRCCRLLGRIGADNGVEISVILLLRRVVDVFRQQHALQQYKCQHQADAAKT